MSELSELPVSIDDLGSCGSFGQRQAMAIRGMRYLCTVGFAPEDVADGIYSHPGILHALEDPDFLEAHDLLAAHLAAALKTVEGSGITEDRLWLLTESGLALGEISWAIRNIGGFQNSVKSLDLDKVKIHAESTYEFFRTGRSTRRTARTTRWGVAGRYVSPSAAPESWFVHYSKVLARAERIRKGSHGA